MVWSLMICEVKYQLTRYELSRSSSRLSSHLMTKPLTTTLRPRSGFSMPAEWETHEATWLAWPHNPTDWPDKLDTIRWVYGEIVRKIAPGEIVRMLVNSAKDGRLRAQVPERARCRRCARVEFILHPTNRGWTRDSGPVFVRRQPAEDETAIVHFHFNAWAKYPDWQKDRRVPETAASASGKAAVRRARRHGRAVRARRRRHRRQRPRHAADHRGVLPRSEDAGAQPRPGPRRFEAALRDVSRRRQRLLARLAESSATTRTGTSTTSAASSIATTVVLIREDNPKDVNYRPLAENWERIQDLRLEDGAKPEVVALPMPAPLFFDGERLPASYANFYISNAAVIVPTFNDPNDRVALGILGELFRDRPVVGIHAVDLVLGFGTLHCLTQQQPD